MSLGLTGISPEDSEKLLIKPVEDEVSNIEGKKEMTSTSYQGGGNVLLEFDAGFDPDQALLDPENKLIEQNQIYLMMQMNLKSVK